MPKLMPARAITTATLASLAAFALVVLLPGSPAWPRNPERDSGVFLYVATRILEGDIPYRDLWDHKPPGVFYVDALALAIGQGSWWAVWGMELLFVLFAAACAYFVCLRYGRLPAALSTVAWLAAAGPLAIGGNQTEGYALAMQFAAYAVWRGRRPAEMRPLHWLAIGAAGAVSMLFKPNLVGTWAAILAVTLLVPGERRQVVRRFPFAIAGGLLVIIPVIVYLFSHDALGPAIDQNFRYSSAYVAGANSEARIRAAIEGLKLVGTYGGALPLLGFIAIPLAWKKSGIRARERDLLLLMAGIDLLLELATASLSGRTYSHYYLCLLPPIAILSAATLRAVGDLVPGTARTRTLVVTLASLVVLFAGLQRVRAALLDRSPNAGTVFRDTAAELAKTATRPGELVLVWGAEPAVNFLADRPAPTRYSYLAPLQTTGYTTAAMIDEFQSDLQRRPPALIIDTSLMQGMHMPIATPLRKRWRPEPGYVPRRELVRVADWIESQYEIRGLLMPNRWILWGRRGDPALQALPRRRP